MTRKSILGMAKDKNKKIRIQQSPEWVTVWEYAKVNWEKSFLFQWVVFIASMNDATNDDGTKMKIPFYRDVTTKYLIDAMETIQCRHRGFGAYPCNVRTIVFSMFNAYVPLYGSKSGMISGIGFDIHSSVLTHFEDLADAIRDRGGIGSLPQYETMRSKEFRDAILKDLKENHYDRLIGPIRKQNNIDTAIHRSNWYPNCVGANWYIIVNDISSYCLYFALQVTNPLI
jgi:hypothetical protein